VKVKKIVCCREFTGLSVICFLEANGDPIGPHRVWLKNENAPGLAMSRSLGDQVAARVGVIPEPGI